MQSPKSTLPTQTPSPSHRAAEAPASTDPGAAVRAFLKALRLGPPRRHGRLTMWPLQPPASPRAKPLLPPPPFLLVHQALEAGDAVVTDPWGDRAPGRIRVENHAGKALLVLRGDPLRGSARKGLATASVLVPPHDAVELDTGPLDSRDHAATGALTALRRRRAVAAAAARRAFGPQPGQVGFVVALGRRIVGLEALGRAEELAAALPRLLSPFAHEALAATHVPPAEALGSSAVSPLGPAPDVELSPAHFEAPQPFLSALELARSEPASSEGDGGSWQLDGAGVRAGALVREGAVVHLRAFPFEAPRPKPGG